MNLPIGSRTCGRPLLFPPPFQLPAETEEKRPLSRRDPGRGVTSRRTLRVHGPSVRYSLPQGGERTMAPNVRLAAAAAGIALAGVLAAATSVEISGHWYGLFLLRGKRDAPLTLMDDLLLGDGSRRLAGVSLGPVRRLLQIGAGSDVLPRLEVEWSDANGEGTIRNQFADGTELITNFSRYVDDDGNDPKVLFVGGALPEIAGARDQNESGMNYHDARGWKHVW